MRPCKAHFVTSCQQLLALGAVLAVLTPAASVVSLDVVHTPGSSAGPPGAQAPAPRQPRPASGPGTPAHQKPPTATVPVAPVEPVVHEVPLTPDEESATGRTPRPRASGRPAPGGSGPETEGSTRTTVLSEPQKVTGYGAVGVTWSHDQQVADDQILLQVRTATSGAWTGWSELEYHDEHAPDPETSESAGTRPGTDPVFVGEVDRVQLRAVAEDGLPEGMSLAVVSPGRPTAVETETPAVPAEQAVADAEPTAAGEDAIELQAATTSAPRPTIFTREQWGADERMRDGHPSYGTISAGFVHHTVNANDYSRDDVPGMLRSIYAYHTQSQGWSDIGYNFLVDKFGRIWEGRYGGVARPVIGAHTLGYNDDSFAMSAIGNFETARPSEAMLRAYGALFAWKLGMAGIDPMDRSQNVSGATFAAINGHRDAGSTACPGQYLYAKLSTIRGYAAEAGEPATPDPVRLEQVDSNLASTAYPDLVVRRHSDGRGMVLPTGGLTKFRRPSAVAPSGWADRTFLVTEDLTGDDRPDLVTVDADGLAIRPGLAAGGFGRAVLESPRFRGHSLVASPGDLDADGRSDLVARADDHRLTTFFRTPRGGFRPVPQALALGGYRQLVAAGDVTGDGLADLWGRDRRGRLLLNRGLGEGTFASREYVAGEYSDLVWLVGGIDYTGDSVPDLVAKRTDGALVLLPSRGDGTVGPAIGPVGDGSDLGMISGAGDIGGNAAPDLVAADTDGALVVVLNRGTFDVGQPVDTGQSFARAGLLLNAGDFDGDGAGDVILRRRVGSLWYYGGRGGGRLAAPRWIGGKGAFRDVTDLRAVVDVTGDGRPDLVGRADGQSVVWPGNGREPLGTRTPIEVADSPKWDAHDATYDWTLPISDLRGMGAPDLVVRDADGFLYRLNGVRSGYKTPRYLGEAGGYDLAG